MKPVTPTEIIRRRFASADFSNPADVPAECGASGEDTGQPDAPLSPKILQLLAERQAVETVTFRPIPLAGQIVRIPPPADQKEAFYRDHLAVLLDSEIAIGKWRGWLVGRDADYSCEWDLLLGPEDEPRDPLCQVVHIWNPLTLNIQEADKVLAELPATRLAAARSMAQDHRRKLLPEPITDHRCGVHLARLLADGTGVVTGTPLAAQGDPRSEYQQLYRELGERISLKGQPAAPAQPRREPETEAASLFDRLRNFLDFGGNWLRPVAAFAILLVVPLLVIQVWRGSPDQTPGSPGGQGTYISGEGPQRLKAGNPGAKAREIETELRALTSKLEIRHDSDGSVMIEADLSAVSQTKRQQWQTRHGLIVPASGRLQLLITP